MDGGRLDQQFVRGHLRTSERASEGAGDSGDQHPGGEASERAGRQHATHELHSGHAQPAGRAGLLRGPGQAVSVRALQDSVRGARHVLPAQITARRDESVGV